MSVPDVDALDILSAKIRLGELVAEYGRLIDWLDWDRLDDVFWPDAQFDFGMFKGDLAAYRTFVRDLEEGYARRLHMFAMPSIRIAGDRAQIDAGSVILCRTAEPFPGIDNHFWGRYLFTALRRGGFWRLSTLTYVLNLFDLRARTTDDRGGPMHLGEGLSPYHPLAGTF